MKKPGRWISLLPILALVPRLGLSVLAADRQAVSADTRADLLWWSSAALAVLVGLAEIYIGATVVSRRHYGLGVLWAATTALTNALIVPLSLSGLQAEPVWAILGSTSLRVAWSSGLGLLSTLCVCGCLWSDLLREEGSAEPYESYLLGRIEQQEREGAELTRQRDTLSAELRALQTAQADASRTKEALADQLTALLAKRERETGNTELREPPTRHSACKFCGFWNPDQRTVAGHIKNCRRRRARTLEGSTAAADSSREDIEGTFPAPPVNPAEFGEGTSPT
jgi:hypothetical protein